MVHSQLRLIFLLGTYAHSVIVISGAEKMGNWQLEVGKMALYIFLPVGAFYLFHQVAI